MNAVRLFLLASALGCLTALSAQEPLRVEYFLDADPGYGTAVALTGVHVGSNALTFDLSTADAGAHVLYVRSQDADGRWSATVARPLFVDSSGPIDPDPQVETDLSRIEYFFDVDPGYGQGIPLSAPRTGANTYTMDFTAVEAGAHVLYLRAADETGRWSPTVARPLFVVPRAERRITALEYFFDDADPGEGKATAAAVPSNTSEPFAFDVDVDALAVGNHQLNVRARDDEGRWSLVSSRPFILSCATSIEWTMPVSLRVEGSHVVLAGQSRSAAWQVEVFTLAGLRLHSCVWPVAQERLELDIPPHTAIIVRAKDQQTGQTISQILASAR